jgi:uncharacterized membrane protein
MAIVVALLTCFVVIPLGAYAVDIGVQRVARGDAQSVADTVALDLARQLGNHNTDAANHASPAGNGAVLASVPQAAGMTGTAPTVRVWQGHLTASAFSANRQSLGCGWRPGDPAPSNGYFSPSADATGTYTAVLVTVTGSVRFNLAGGSGGVCRSAVASAASLTCFTVGSYVANLSNETGLLSIINPPLGSQLSVVGYQGLASEDITITSLDTALKALQADAGIGSPQGLAATDITLSQLLGAEAGVLRAAGNTTQADIVDNYVGTLTSATANANIAAQVATLVSTATGNGEAASAGVNALDLLGTAAMVADGQHFLSDYVASRMAGFTADVTLVDGAHEACGVTGAQATSDQVKVAASEALPLTALATALSGIVGGLTVGPFGVIFSLDTGQATGTLGTVTCNPDDIPISVTSTLASAGLSAPVSITANGLSVLSLPSLLSTLGVTATVDLRIAVDLATSTSGAGGTTPLEWTMGQGTPPDSYSTIKSTGANAATLPQIAGLTSDDITVTVTPHLSIPTVLGVPVIDAGTAASSLTSWLVPAIKTAVLPVLNSLVSTLNSTVDTLNPLLQTLQQSLGLSFPGADVTVKPTATCSRPYLG